MKKKVNDGGTTGMKLDKFRHSRFDRDDSGSSGVRFEMSYKSPNTLGGITAENRGRRTADEMNPRWLNNDSPFENGKSSNWNNREGWDNLYNRSYDRSFKKHGGNLIGHDIGHKGRGPKGYKRSDESIYDDVCQLLTMSSRVDASQIEVSVKDGIVYLEGKIQSRQMKKFAELEIDHVSGVHDVQNRLDFTEQPTRH
jgi:hypothetical protein